jgi:WD40 repeat protein
MKPRKRFWLRAASLLVPVILFFAIRDKQSWRPRVLGQMKSGITALAWSPDGKWLASVGSKQTTLKDGVRSEPGGEILLWNVEEKTSRRVRQKQGAAIDFIKFLKDGRLVYSTYSGESFFYDVQKGVQSPKPPTLKGVDWLAISDDGRWLFSSWISSDWQKAEFRLHDTQTGKVVKLSKADPRGISLNSSVFSADGKQLALFAAHSQVVKGPQIWVWNTNAPHKPFIFPVEMQQDASTLHFWPNDDTLTLKQRGRLWMFNPQNGKQIGRWECDGELQLAPDGQLIACEGAPDGLPCIVVYKYPSTKRWHQTEEARLLFDEDALAFSPDSRTLAVGDDKGRITLWRVK